MDTPGKPKEKRDKRPSRAPRRTFTVSADVIASAVQRHSGHCVIADAINAAIPGAMASVDLQTIRITDRKRGARDIYLTPRQCQVNLVKFDQGVNPDPFEFQLSKGQSIPIRQHSKTRRTPRTASPVTTANPVPHIVGGTPPPLGPLAHGPNVAPGKRRAFGLRALEY